MEFPLSAANGEKIVVVVVKEVGFMRTFCTWSFFDKGPDVFAVDGMRRKLSADEASDGREQIDGHRGLCHCAGGDRARPGDDARDAHATFPNRALPFAEFAR